MGQNTSSKQSEGSTTTTTISKKLVNDPVQCVTESLQGFVLTNADVKLLEGHNVVVRADLESFRKSGKVALITGKQLDLFTVRSPLNHPLELNSHLFIFDCR